MLAEAGSKLGLEISLYFNEENPCGARGAKYVRGELNDQRSIAEFARANDLLTAEFENIPSETLRWAAAEKPVLPAPENFEIAQDRLREKELAASVNIPVPAYRSVGSESELENAFRELGSQPAILKSRTLGYDGKGQARIRTASECSAAWHSIGGRPALLEELFPFEREISVIAVRGMAGELRFYDLAVNTHRDGILVRSVVSPESTSGIQAQAEAAAARVLEKLGYVGVLALEFFERAGTLYLNEIAPRVHNTGHWTIEGAECSQFENHLRAIAGMTLGPTGSYGPVVMLNIIGAEPDINALSSLPGAHVHMYGKAPRKGRKLGHLTIVDPADGVVERAQSIIGDPA